MHPAQKGDVNLRPDEKIIQSYSSRYCRNPKIYPYNQRSSYAYFGKTKPSKSKMGSWRSKYSTQVNL